MEGDPAMEGPFTLRLQLPDGFSVPPHWHPAVEHVTVISGTFNLGMGEKFDKFRRARLVSRRICVHAAGNASLRLDHT